MKNIDKIIYDTEFIVLKKTNGWKGWNIFARHTKFSKYSVSLVQEKKPRLTAKLKKEIILQALEEESTYKHNIIVNEDLMGISNRIKAYENDLTYIIRSNVKVFKLIKNALESECEYKEVNQALQRLLDMQCEFTEYKTTSSKLKKFPSRVIRGKEEE